MDPLTAVAVLALALVGLGSTGALLVLTLRFAARLDDLLDRLMLLSMAKPQASLEQQQVAGSAALRALLQHRSALVPHPAPTPADESTPPPEGSGPAGGGVFFGGEP